MKKLSRFIVGLFLGLLVIIVVLVFLLLHSLGIRKSQKTVLAQVNGVKIMLSDFNRFYSSSPTFYQDFIKKNKNKFLDDLINRELLFQEAKRKKIDRYPEVREKLQDWEKDILVASLAKEEILKKIAVSENEIKSYYEKHPEEFVIPETTPSQTESFAQAKERIKNLLVKYKEMEVFGEYLEKLRKRAKIKVNQELFNKLATNTHE